MRLDTQGYSLDAASHDGVRIGNDAIAGVSATHTVTIEAPANDGNREADTVTLRAFLGPENDLVEEDALAITVADPMTVTIGTGGTSGHTMVSALEDDTAEEAEVLTLFAVVDGVQMTDVSVTLRLWDAAVPALPFAAPLVLAAILAAGAVRRRGRMGR